MSLALAAGSGTLVGLILALVGGGGSILAVPLLLFVVGLPSTHVAIGTGAVVMYVSVSGLLRRAHRPTRPPARASR